MRQFGIAVRALGFIAVALGALVVGMTALHAQSPGNAACAWGCVYTPPSQSDRYLRGVEALNEHVLGNAGKGGNGGGNTTNNYYNAPVTNNSTYNGPVTNSGSTVTNVHNLNETSTIATASGGSTVFVKTTTDQDAHGGQAGTASTSVSGDNSWQNVAPNSNSGNQ